jgi:filamentous hemagglutinin family protein
MKKRFNFGRKNALKNNIIRMFSTIALASTVSLLPAYSQQIVPDGKTQTSLNMTGAKTSVYTKTIQGKNAFNSFEKFNVNENNVVNLMVPDNAANLINLIHSEKSVIKGVLNSYAGGKIGGNIFLVNPHGITVGSQGVINVGSLTAVTPTDQFMKSFFTSTGQLSEKKVNILLNNEAPINHEASIINYGDIRAIESVRLDAGEILNSGSISLPYQPEVMIEDIVNTETVSEGQQLAISNGKIVITALNNITNAGSIVADGADNVDGGSISIVAGNNVYLEPGSLVSAKGIGENSSGGDIYSWGTKGYYFNPDAVLDARGGALSGNGGFVEVSTRGCLYFEGDIYTGREGRAGNILIDPKNITISDGTGVTIADNDQFSENPDSSVIINNSDLVNLLDNPNNVTLQANNDITVTNDIIVNNASGDGGDLNLQAGRSIAINANITTDNGDFTAIANDPNANSTYRDTGTANITIASDKSIDTGNGDITLDIQNGHGTAGSITDGNTGSTSLTGNNITLSTVGGTIGSSTSNYLEIDTGSSTSGKLTATTTDQNIYIKETTGDLYLDSKAAYDAGIDAGTGNVYLSAPDGKIAKANDNYDWEITGNDIELIADTGIEGSATWSSLRINALNNLTAITDSGNIKIVDCSGIVKLNEISTNNGDVDLATVWNFIDGRGTEDPNISANNITLFANHSNIGGAGTDDIDIDLQGGTLTATTSASYTGSIYIEETNGNLTINNVNAAGGAGNVYLTSDGNITDTADNGNPNIIGNNISLTSSTGTIGSSTSNYLEIDTGSTTSAVLSADTSAGGGNIYITETSGNLYIPSVDASTPGIDAGTGDVNIVSEGTIYDASSNGYANIEGNNISLTSTTGTIGTGTTTEDIFEINSRTDSDGVLNLNTTNHSVFVKETSGDLYIDSINTGIWNAYIYSNGSILDGNPNETADVSGANIVSKVVYLYNLGGGNIGSENDDLDIISSYNSSSGYLFTQGQLYHNIEQVSGNLYVSAVSNVGRADIKLKAAGSILDYTSTPNTTPDIYGRGIELIADNGTIGTSGNPFDIILNYSYGGTSPLDATATGGIFIDQVQSGNLYVASVNAGSADVILTSAGSILDGNTGSADAKITGDLISLTAGTNSNIGGSGAGEELEIDSGSSGVTASATTGSIYLKEVGTDPTLVVDSINAQDNIYLKADYQLDNTSGAISTTANNSTITLVTDDTNLAGGTVATGTGGTLTIQNATSQNIGVGEITEAAGVITQDEIDTFTSDNIEIGDTTNTLAISLDTAVFSLTNSEGTGPSNIAIISHGNITDTADDGSADLTGNNISLTSSTGTIGSSTSNYLEIDTGSTTSAVLSADTSAGGGNIYITETSGNLYIPSVDASTPGIDAGTGDVNIVSEGTIYDASSNGYANIEGNNISLTSTTGTIGTGTTTEDIFEINSRTDSDGVLNLNTTNHSVFVKETSGDLYIDSINTGIWNAYIYSNGSILDGNPNETADVSGANIVSKVVYLYNLGGGNIGSENDDLDIISSYNSSSGYLFTQGQLYHNIEQVSGNLYVSAVSNVGRADIKLKAAGSILDYTSTPNTTPDIYGRGIELIADNGTIGTSGNPFDIILNYSYGGTSPLDATATGGIFIDQVQSGNLYVASVNAGSADVILTSAGSILDGNTGSADAKITGDLISLTAGTNSNIGGSGAGEELEIDSGSSGVTASATTGSIYLKEVGTDPTLVVDSINAQDNIYLKADYQLDNTSGAISTTANNSTITLVTDDTNLAGGTVATGTGGTLTIQNATSQNIGVGEITEAAGVITQDEIDTFTSDNIEIGDTTNTLAISLDTAVFSLTNSEGTGPSNIAIISHGNITDTADDGSADLTGNNISLTSSTGTIGSSTSNYLEVDTGSTANAVLSADTSAGDGNIYLKETSGDLYLTYDLTNSKPGITAGSGDVYIKSAGNISEAVVDWYTKVFGANITLEASGNIGNHTGGVGGYLDINSSVTDNGAFTAKSDDGNISIRDNYGDGLSIKLIDADADNDNTVGDVNLYVLGEILDSDTENESAIIKAKNISLTSYYSNIGSSSTGDIDIDTNYHSSGGVLSADTSAGDGNIYLKETEKDLSIHTINAGTGTVGLRTADPTNAASILDGNPSEDPNIIAKNITLITTNGLNKGSIGTLEDDLNIDSNYNGSIDGKVSLQTYSRLINVKENTGDLYLNYAATASSGYDVIITSAGSIFDACAGEGSSYANIYGNNIKLSANGSIGSESDELDIYVSYYSPSGVLKADTSNANGNIYLDQVAGNLYIPSVDTNTPGVNAGSGDVTLTAAGAILDSDDDADANIKGNNIILTSTGSTIGTSEGHYLDIDSGSTLSADTTDSNSNIFIRDIDTVNVKNVNAGTGDVYLTSAGSILDGNTGSADAKITGDLISLTAGTNGNIGADTTDAGLLEIDSGSSGVTASATTGSIYLKEVGTDPTLVVDTITAQDNIYLRADYKLQNFSGSTISTTAENSTITLVTDDTKLYNELTSTGGTVSTGTGGIVTFGRETEGNIHAGYTGSDNATHPGTGITTYITDYELDTVTADFIMLDPSNGDVIWGDATEQTIIISDNYDFSNAFSADEVYILRKTAGIVTLGGDGTVGSGHIIQQTEIDNITANSIYIGNVGPYPTLGAETTEIQLVDPDFSQTTTSNDPADITLKASDAITDISAAEGAGIGLKAKNVTLLVTDTGSYIGDEDTYDVDIVLLNDGKLNASADEDIYLANTTGNMNLDYVSSANGSVTLKSISNIVDANANDLNVLSAYNVIFSAGNSYDSYSVGSLNDPIEINSATSGTGYLSATTHNLYLEETEGNLYVNLINQNLTNSNIVNLKATDSNGASILDYDNDLNGYNIKGNDVYLYAPYGSIGSGTNYYNDGTLKTRMTYLTAEAGTEDGTGNINIYNNPITLYIKSMEGNNTSVITLQVDTDSYGIFSYNNDFYNNYIQGNKINLKTGGTGDVRDINIGVKLIGNNPVINANAYKEMYIYSDMDMYLDLIQVRTTSANGKIALFAPSILSAKTDHSANIQGNKSYYAFLGASGSIGESDNKIELANVDPSTNYNYSELSFYATSGDVYINNQGNQSNNMNQFHIIESASPFLNTAPGDINISSANTISVDKLSAGGDIILTSGRNIIDYLPDYGNENTLIQGTNVSLIANNSIGSSGYGDIEIDVSGLLTANANGAIYLHSDSAVEINSLTSTGSLISLTTSDDDITINGPITAYNGSDTWYDVTLDTGGTTGSILTTTQSPTINIIGNDINLTAQYVGSQSYPIEVELNDNTGDVGTLTCTATSCYVNEN